MLRTPLATPRAAVPGPYQVSSPCDTGCVAHRAPKTGRLTAARRLRGATASLTGTGPVGARAAALLDALEVTVDTNATRLSVPAETGTLVVANHISWLDIPGLLAIEQTCQLAKAEIAEWPVIGGQAARAGTVFIDRWSIRSLPDAVASLATTLRAGRSVLVFPAATTWCRAPGGTFRRAAFQAAIEAGAPVRPVRIDYLQRGEPSTVPAYIGEDSLVRSVARVLRAGELTMRVRVRPEAPHHGERRALAAAAYEAVCTDV
ncbi:lysophospholipid acyltransferase family protein [Sciscionella marina]|uniref:lysophospholipid acyltransferase family protein n=1 Tax=Sciscionella marina TaxID=508770 RepID=UPI0009FDB756|nr:lysophospholipid acyltransferase family protein [Sciscionella marina]